VTTSDVNDTILRIHKLESARLVAGLMRIVRDIGLAEELAQDALVAALEEWPRRGVPDNPGAWLMTTAKNRALNALRRGRLLDQKHVALARELESSAEERMAAMDPDDALDDEVGDDVLRLVFIACHPVLSIESRVALTLRLLGGLTTEEIARAFLTSEPTIAQRIVRAKRTLAEEKVPFEMPRGEDLAMRLSAVLGVLYLVFNEGYSATSGDDLLRPQLCTEAIRLGHVLAGVAPNEPEVFGLLALMELQQARSAARTNAAGETVLLLDQDRTRWDLAGIDRGLEALDRVRVLRGDRGPYALQAAIAACHARAKLASDTDWSRIAALYGELAQVTPSLVVELNRAMAVSMASGPLAGLEILDRLVNEPALASYHLLPGARADMLEKLGRFHEAAAELDRAAALTRNAREQKLLTERAAACRRRVTRDRARP